MCVLNYQFWEIHPSQLDQSDSLTDNKCETAFVLCFSKVSEDTIPSTKAGNSLVTTLVCLPSSDRPVCLSAIHKKNIFIYKNHYK